MEGVSVENSHLLPCYSVPCLPKSDLMLRAYGASCILE